MRRAGVDSVTLRALSDAGSVFALVLDRIFFEELTNADARIGGYARRNVTGVASLKERESTETDCASIMPDAF